MLIDNVSELFPFASPRSPEPGRVLMANPEHFDVTYAINDFMKDAEGKLQKIDRARAQSQWNSLRDTYQKIGFPVETLPPPAGFPDFVFCANQSLPFWDVKKNKPAVIMSRMRSEFRRGEVETFEAWYKSQGYDIHHLESGTLCLEGNGDALIQPGGAFIWGGVGPRTDRDVYHEVSKITERPVVILELVDPRFYHLDTCFSILNAMTVVIQPRAFSERSLALIRKLIPHVVETEAQECATYFTGNCHSPNGKVVILQTGAKNFEAKLTSLGYRIVPVDTSEFMKSGGSVFCMKMMCY